VQLHNTNAVVHAAFLLFVLLLQARAAGKTAWLESITFVTLSTFGGTIVAPLLLRQPPDILTNDIIVPVIAVTWYMVNQSPRDAVPRVLSKPVLHQLLVALMETYRASTLCTMVAAASTVLNSTTTSVQTPYTVALFGPIIVGTVTASAGLFLPCDRGLSCLELGLPWPIQSAIYAATFYHIAVYDTGAVGGALRTYILGDSVDAATVSAVIAAVFAVTGVLQTTFGPGFNLLRPLNLLNYAITGVRKVPAAFKKARKTAAVRHTAAPPSNGINSRANGLTLRLSNGNSTHHNGTTATVNGSSINSNSATAAARLLNLSGHSKRTSRLRGNDKGTTTAKTANTNAISVNSNCSKDDGNVSHHSEDSVSSSNTTIHQTVRKPVLLQHAESKKRVIKLTVKQKWQQWIENTTLPLLLLMWLLKQLLYADNRQFWSAAAVQAAAATEKAQHIAVTFLTLQWWGGLEVCLVVFALMGSMKVRQGSARTVARNSITATAVKTTISNGTSHHTTNGQHATTSENTVKTAAVAAALNNSDHNVMSRLRRLSILNSTPVHWLEGVSTVCITTFGGGILAPLLLRQPPTLFTNDLIVPAVATSWYLVNHSWRDSVVTVSALSGVHHLLVILAEVSLYVF
jgi:uncharacterized membrane protein YeiH